MQHFSQDGARRCMEHWFKELEILLNGNGSLEFKIRRGKLLAERAYACMVWKLEELDRHVKDMDPNY